KAILRRLSLTSTDNVIKGFKKEVDVDEVMKEAEKSILELSHCKNVSAFSEIKDVLIEVYNNNEHLHHHDADITGLATGYRDLDHITSGFQRNDLIIIAARPSVGKTAFALNIAQNVAINTDENVAIFSLEMGAEQLVSRMLSAE